jgi:hypothetical protein
VTASPGDPVRIVMTKWGDRPHWEFDGVLLGSDQHGDWIGIPAGSHMARPGMELHSRWDQVGLVPPAGPDADRGWLATFHAEGNPVRTYVDMTTPPAWDDAVVRAVDLDLDVVKTDDGRGVYVDDEDEFAEHQLLFGYPPEVVQLAERSAAWVHDAVLRGLPPFDGTADGWLAQVTGG